MEPLRAVSVKKPKRTSSVPGSLRQAAYRRSVPQALVDAVCAARERFERYGASSLLRTVVEPPGDGAREAARSGDKKDRDDHAQQPQLDSSALLPEVTSTPPSSSEANTNACAASTEPIVGEAERDTAAADAVVTDDATPTAAGTPKARLTASETCIPYDTAVTREAMGRLRHVLSYCPEKIAAFLQHLREVGATRVSEISAAPLSTVPRGKPSSSAHHTARQREALSELWGERRDAPVSVSTTIGRKRGLFGGVEQKQLHQCVISVLNRVSNDAVKFREVKNELLRLPIPEANDVMLAKIAEVFFFKAVQEQHFSCLYADLVSALCKVPEGQRLVGDKAQSLEYRLRQQLLHRCQVEFQQLEEQNIERAEKGGEDRDSQGAEEAFKERRDRACGIVRFVGELFLRQIVTEKVIESILMTACTGLYGREGLRVPPPYTPTESQMDEAIMLLSIVDTAFFRTTVGAAMLMNTTNVLKYWCIHHPVSRVRFLLMNAIEKLNKIVEKRNAALAAAQEKQQQQPQQHAEEQQQQQPVQEGKRLVNGGSVPQSLSSFSEENLFASTDGRTAVAACDMSPRGRLPMFVGGKPIPAPRSAASRQNSITSSISVNGPTNPIPQVMKQVATPESVANHMQNVTVAGRSLDEVVNEITNTFADVLAVVEVWTERCLTIVKAVKDRAMYGGFLSSINQHHKGALKQELRKVAMGVFAYAVSQRLYEDLSIFKYWAAMIWSDASREVLDEDLLNEALRHLLTKDAAAVRLYLCDVSKQLQLLTSVPRAPSDEATNFVRYRPLQVVHRHNTHRKQDYELSVVNFFDVRSTSMEINVFCTLLTGTPTKEALFNAVRSSAYLRCPLVAPEVLSAILHAELCSNTTAYLEDNLDLLSLVSDGQDRGVRELLLVAELYAALKDDSSEALRPLSAGARVMAKLSDRIISDETRLRAQKYFESRDDCAHHYIGAPASHGQTRHANSDGLGTMNTSSFTNSIARRPGTQRR
ncbi:putative eukaryotic initiation factor 4a [Trypanosoma rangeli]|uniref:Putative eukaryotic initiation factor 4a n=1 Tax=Trypanosoma rangeli TaxID=5698 RepID=A0A3R7KHW3_TRYRA|nr:putative eukaryotic initiation factor 4a [Trypanosoma rangeli]RNF07965.1 putative eukaryotic initiation factor 4a [Trypanosoma rangeli]|eukprot:RNF07965.1 putative eukaryotic initiation factor 4a [Trypanosoma rangeli]